jgi:tetratricopeptide (TPR) repeat protein
VLHQSTSEHIAAIRGNLEIEKLPMFSRIVLAMFLGAISDEKSASPSRPELATLREVAAKAGKNADAHVRVALWCEAHGLTAERLKHLSLAVLYDPSHTLARGLLGLVAFRGKWERPDQVSREVQDDPDHKARIQEYLKRRVQLRERADDHWKLAVWCEQNGLKEQASAHLYQVLRLDPWRESAWKHLGYKKVSGRWVKPDDAAAAKVEAREQQKANNHWKPILERLRNGVQSKEAARRAEAEKALAQINDRRAVPVVWSTFGRGDAALQKVAVQVLGQIDDPAASRSLVMLAVFGGSQAVRSKAIETLRLRDAREFAGLLIEMIQQTIRYEVKKVGGPGQPGELLIKGQGPTPNLRRIYAPPPGPSVTQQPGDQVRLDENGLPVIFRPQSISTLQLNYAWLRAFDLMSVPTPPSPQKQNQLVGLLSQSGLGAEGQKIGQLLINAFENQYRIAATMPELSQDPLLQLASITQNGVPINPGSEIIYTMVNGVQIPVGQMEAEAQKSADAAARQLDNDVDAIERYNRSLDQINDRVLPVLENISGQKLGADNVAWQKWLNNLVGFNSLQASEPPTVTENVPLAYQPQPIPLDTFTVPINVERKSCFGQGTKVRTLAGLEPIESLKLGDQVLTQNMKTGSLGYKPILVVHHNPPAKTFEIKLGDETIVSSYFHRFWKAGKGWVMARELKTGDRIRTLNGTVRVTAINEGKVVPVFNLDVADDADFFVGDLGALAHDNTLPNLREKPFDAVSNKDFDETSVRD